MSELKNDLRAPRCRVQAIIQARMNSSRLPGKILLKLADRPIIDHIIRRVTASKLVDRVVVATTGSAIDDALVEYLRSSTSAHVFRGSEDNVLERFFQCSSIFPSDIIVRITADDPLKDPAIIDRAITFLLEDSELDYCSNTTTPTFPEGLDVECFRSEALARAYREARLPSETEHVTPYIWKNPALFKALCFKHSEDLSSWRWTLDKPEDYEFMKVIYEQFSDGSNIFSYSEVIDFIKSNPHVQKINDGTIRNEGYYKSINVEQSR